MTTFVFIAVLGAAALHAAWNALLKQGSEKTMSMGAIVLGHVPLALIALPFVPTPAIESYPYLGGGILLHAGYQVFLLKSYQNGDLTQVYPIARGTAPLLVAVFSAAVLGVTFEPLQTLAIVIIGCGILSLALVRRADGQRNTHAAKLALVTGVFIASYSLVDGLGARLAGTSLGFYSWLSLGNGTLMAAYLAIVSPKTLRKIASKGRGVFLIGGGASFTAYAIVIWAFTQAPIALVTALRETSIVFALVIGVFFLKERLNLIKLLSTFLTVLGAALLRYAKN